MNDSGKKEKKAKRKGLPKPNKLVLIGIVIALIAGAGSLYAYYTKSGGTIGGSTTTILVAAHDIHYLQILQASDITTKAYSQADVPTGTYTDQAALLKLGVAANVAIPKDTPITASEVGKPYSLPIPSGYVAMTLPTGDMQGVAGNIQAGDYITIVASKGAVTKTIYTQVYVLRAGPAVFGSPSGIQNAPTVNATSLTVVVTQCMAEYLNWILNNDQFRYTLESTTDFQGATDKDPSCPSITSAHGVTATDINAKWPGLA